MKKILREFLVALLLILTGNSLLAQKIIFKEDFESNLNTLESKGWNIAGKNSKGIKLISSNPISGNKSLEVKSSGVKYANILVPVQSGKKYYGSVKMRYINVRNRKLSNPSVQRNRGAVMFFQLRTKAKKHLNGGTFPGGRKGTSIKWVIHKVKETKAMPKYAAYINLTIGVESLGTAVFDDIIIYEMADTISIISPSLNQTLKDNRPTLKWFPELKASVKLSKDPSFPKKDTYILYDTKGNGRVTLDFSLTKGKWHWMVNAKPTIASLAKSSFEVENVNSLKKFKVIELWKNKFTGAVPELKFKVFPYLKNNKVTVKIDGKDAVVKDIGSGFYSFIPSQKIAEKVYHVEIIINGKTSRFIYSTVNRKNKISFRKDNTMLIDGKPFFPIGTYRDPSDWLIFTGVKEGGFNMAHSYCFEEESVPVKKAKKYLADAERNGIKVFMGISRKKIAELDKFWLQNFCASLKNSSSLVTWYLFDEPIAHRIPLFTLSSTIDYLRSVDSETPISTLFTKYAVNDSKNLKWYRDSKLMDIFWFDYYPVHKATFDAVYYYKLHCKAKKAAGSSPFWAVVQGSDLNVYPNARTKTVRYPTAIQTRLMAHILLAAGADGLIWYWGPKSAYHMKKDAPHVWAGICKTTREIKKLFPYLVGDRTKIKLAVPGNVQYWSAKNKSKQIVSIINLSHKPTKVKIKFPKSTPENLTLFGTDETKTLDNSTLNTVLKSYEVKIYSWEE